MQNWDNIGYILTCVSSVEEQNMSSGLSSLQELSSLIACWNCSQNQQCMLNVRGREQSEEWFAFSRDKMGNSCNLYRLSLLDCVGYWSFWGKVVLALVAQKHFLFSWWQERKGRNWLDKQEQPHWIVFQVVWWWQKHSCVQSSQLEQYAWQGNSRFSLWLMDWRFRSAGSSCLEGLTVVSERTSSERRSCDWKSKGPALCERCSCAAHHIGSSQVILGKMREALTLVVAEYWSFTVSFV